MYRKPESQSVKISTKINSQSTKLYSAKYRDHLTPNKVQTVAHKYNGNEDMVKMYPADLPFLPFTIITLQKFVEMVTICLEINENKITPNA